MATSITTDDAHARVRLQQDLAAICCKVHQPDDKPLFTREPVSPMRTHHWRWRELEPMLARLGSEIDLGLGGPRRTLRLVSPGLDAGTTATFWASIQVILPGEVADAHRHTANAFRFVMRGSGATTTVDGESYAMHEGDLVLTPGGTWHDHEHHGDEPMVWLDVLDIPLMNALHASFFEPGQSRQQAASPVPDPSFQRFGAGLMRPPGAPLGPDAGNPLLAYPAAMARAALASARLAEADPCDDVVLEYQNPLNGRAVTRTMGMLQQVLRPGFEGRRRRSTGSKLYHAIEGAGRTTVGDAIYDWTAGDFFTVPPWTWHAHANPSGSDAALFQVNDHPAMRALGFLREEIAA